MRELRPLWIGLLAVFAGCVPGEVGDPCGSRGLGECAGDQYCSYPESASCGEADAPGACAEVPEVCTKELRPVCGCDGETYDNPCLAASAGVSVRGQGACEGGGDGTFCGGFAGIQCPADQFCNFAPETQCGSGDQGGVCASKPEACAEIYDPVCGCDDKTYGNACAAASAGVSVLSKGECPTVAGAICGGQLGAQCPDDQFCSFAPEAQCGAADQTGTCARRPEACTFDYNPVCGCDDKTYGNACAAASAGVSVVSRGECTP